MSGSTKTQRGRPKGAKTSAYVQVQTEATRCPKCSSTEREGYNRRKVIKAGGMIDDRPYTHIVLQWTRCKGCGQHRIDRTHENLIGKTN